jgi:hypothetical protein
MVIFDATVHRCKRFAHTPSHAEDITPVQFYLGKRVSTNCYSIIRITKIILKRIALLFFWGTSELLPFSGLECSYLQFACDV